MLTQPKIRASGLIFQTFRRVYEAPILASRQPDATAEERQLGRQRAIELNRLVAMFCLRRTEEVGRFFLVTSVENS